MKKFLALLALLAGTSIYSHSQCSFTTTSLPIGVVGRPYTSSIQTSCGTSKKLARPAGYPPLGLNISGSTGAVSGTPALAGTYYFKMSVSGTGGTATQEYRLQVVDNLTILVFPQTAPIPCGTPFQVAMTVAQGGIPPYTWTATGLPTGLTMDSVSGVISGSVACQPTSQIFNISVTVTDSGSPLMTAQVAFNVKQ